MKAKTIFVLSLIFCLSFVYLLPVNTSSEIEEDPSVPGWSRDIRITNTSVYSGHPSIAVDLKGWVHIVWQEDDGATWGIYYKKSTDGGVTWSKARRINALSRCGYSPSITVDEHNILHLVWRGSVGNWEIYYKNSMDGGNTWSNDTRLTYARRESFVPYIVAYENTLHVVWSDKRDGNFEIYYKRSTDRGKSWSEDVRLTRHDGSGKLPSVVVDLLGQVHVVWYDKRGEFSKVYYTYSRNGGVSWENETCISACHNMTYVMAAPPVTLIDSDNNLHVIWQDGPAYFEKIFYRKKIQANDSWEEEKKIVENTPYAQVPMGVLDSDDVLHIVWRDGRNGSKDYRVEALYYKRYKLQENMWSVDTRISFECFWCGGIKVALSNDNFLHAVWFDGKEGNYEIYYKRTLNPVTEPPVIVTQTLSASKCKPGSSIIVSGNAKWNNTPVVNANVSVKIIGTNIEWNTTTDLNGNYNLTITAPNTPRNYTIRVRVTFGNLSGTRYAKLSVTHERSEAIGFIVYLVIGGAIASGIIVAFVLFRLKRPGIPKVEKQKEERKLDLGFPSKTQILTLRCPECKMTFSVETKQKPFHVKCPNCGKEGMVK